MGSSLRKTWELQGFQTFSVRAGKFATCVEGEKNKYTYKSYLKAKLL